LFFVRAALHPEFFTHSDFGLIEDMIEAGKAGERKIVVYENAGFSFEAVGFEGRSAAVFMGDTDHFDLL
jgi:hypothetical protein